MRKEYKVNGKIHIEAVCRKCGCESVCTVIVGPFGPHYAKAICPECGAFIKWVTDKLWIKSTRKK